MDAPNTTQPTQPQPTQPQPQPQPVPAQPPAPVQPVELQTDFTDFQIQRLSCTPFEQKTIPGTGPQANPPSAPQFYYQIPLLYNFGEPIENRKLNDFLFEACEMDSKFGIQSKVGQSGRPEHSIMVTLDGNIADQARFIETTGQLHAGCAYILGQMKGGVKLPLFNAQMAEATGLKNPVHRPRDEVTGELIQGRNPSMFLKLFSRGKPPMVEQTLFTGLDGKPIPWTLLTGVEIKFIPLIHVKRIYVGGGKASIQMEVTSAVVTSVRARNTSTRQTGTIERLKGARPELADAVAAQLAKLTADRQDQMLGLVGGVQVAHHQDPQHAGEAQPTFAGIAPTGQRQVAQPMMAQITQGGGTPTMATLPAIPPLGGATPTMQEFTATAPPRAPTVGIPGFQGAAPMKFA